MEPQKSLSIVSKGNDNIPKMENFCQFMATLLTFLLDCCVNIMTYFIWIHGIWSNNTIIIICQQDLLNCTQTFRLCLRGIFTHLIIFLCRNKVYYLNIHIYKLYLMLSTVYLRNVKQITTLGKTCKIFCRKHVKLSTIFPDQTILRHVFS